jgi:hypothetical protein
MYIIQYTHTHTYTYTIYATCTEYIIYMSISAEMCSLNTA